MLTAQQLGRGLDRVAWRHSGQPTMDIRQVTHKWRHEKSIVCHETSFVRHETRVLRHETDLWRHEKSIVRHEITLCRHEMTTGVTKLVVSVMIRLLCLVLRHRGLTAVDVHSSSTRVRRCVTHRGRHWLITAARSTGRSACTRWTERWRSVTTVFCA